MSIYRSFRSSISEAGNYLRSTSKWMKLTWCLQLGVLFSIMCPNMDCFLDTMILVTCYTLWMSVSLPSLYRKLTFKFVFDVIYVLTQLFIADFMVFFAHRTLSRYVRGDDPDYESNFHRGFLFVMNSVRIGVIVYCIGRSVPAFIKYASKKHKKMEKRRKSKK